MSKKYLRKNEFRYSTSPNVLRHDGKGHPVYITAKYGHKTKQNVITHSMVFFNQPTEKLIKNPNRMSKDKRPSYFSVPFWDDDKHLTPLNYGYWKMSKDDRKRIKNFNKKTQK